MGLAPVFKAPCEVLKVFSATDEGSVFVSFTFDAGTGPIFVTTIV